MLAVKWAPIAYGPVPGPGLGISGLQWRDTASTGLDSPLQWRQFETRGVPSSLASAGVRRVRWAVVIMHRPWCLWQLDSHAREDREADLGAWAQDELTNAETLVALHHRLSQAGVPALVTSYADLLWPEQHHAPYVLDRLHAFAPCAGRASFDWAPVRGRDVFPDNMMKTCGAQGCSTVRSYGAAHPPEPLGIDTSTGRCTQPPDELYAGLDAAGRQRAAAAEEYLLGLVATAPSQKSTREQGAS